MLPFIYVLFTLVVVMILLLAYRRVLQRMTIPAKERSRKFTKVMIYLGIWFGYLVGISVTGILKDLNFPPKFPLLIFLPIVIFYVVFFRSSKKSRVIKAIPSTWLAYFQSFRIVVELLLYFTFTAGIVPKSATFEGLNFDIFMGISALLIGYFFVGKRRSRSVLYVWNTIGILMVLFVGFIIATSMYAPQIWGSEVPLVNLKFVEMPYLLLAGFLAPLAIFVHLLSILKLRIR
jgi:hypothetical protein